MSFLDSLKAAMPIGDDQTNTTHRYVCEECGNVFSSAKTPDRAQCMDCLSHEVSEQS